MQTDGWLVGERIRHRFVWRQPGGCCLLGSGSGGQIWAPEDPPVKKKTQCIKEANSPRDFERDLPECPSSWVRNPRRATGRMRTPYQTGQSDAAVTHPRKRTHPKNDSFQNAARCSRRLAEAQPESQGTGRDRNGLFCLLALASSQNQNLSVQDHNDAAASLSLQRP